MLIDKTVPVLPSVAELAKAYDAWMCDIWGVIHNGVDTFGEAVEACCAFRAGGGTVVLITNAPRPRSFVEQQLAGMGVPSNAFDAVVTSGDVTLSLLRQREGQKVFHIGPERDRPMLDGIDLLRAEPHDADFILNSGPYDDDNETPDDYRALFESLMLHKLPMICANPDMMVERGGKLIYCAGALAALYAELGGHVIYAGKPYPPIYDLALSEIEARRGAGVARPRILGIGDGVNTDVKGAADFGMDALYIASAVHLGSGGEDLSTAGVFKLFSGKPFRPVAAQSRLTW